MLSGVLGPSNAPASLGRGFSVTISGLNFGASDPTATASLGAECSTASWTTQTTLVCRQNIYAAISTAIGVTALAIVGPNAIGTLVGAFTFDGKRAAWPARSVL